MSALAARPVSDLASFAVGAIPGASFPADRLVGDLAAMEATLVYSAFDADAAGRRLTNRVRWALDEAGIFLAPLTIPTGSDLSDVLAAVPVEARGETFAQMLREARA